MPQMEDFGFRVVQEMIHETPGEALEYPTEGKLALP